LRSFALALLGILLCVPSWASAQTGSEDEALRQLEFAQSELHLSNFQKALTSSESALRLHPPLYEALAYKALALEGLGDFKVAESLLVTYREIRQGWDKFPEGADVLARVRTKLGARTAELEALAALPAFDDVSELDSMPQFPEGSEEFLQWLVMRQQIDNAQTRVQAGGGLLGSGVGLLVGGAVALGISSALSPSNPNDANIEAFYAGGLGAVFAGGALTVAGLPITIEGASRIARLKKGGVANGQARLDATAHGLALRF
jgi:tetratricopeptide (TPR) repeat protein